MCNATTHFFFAGNSQKKHVENEQSFLAEITADPLIPPLLIVKEGWNERAHECSCGLVEWNEKICFATVHIVFGTKQTLSKQGRIFCCWRPLFFSLNAGLFMHTTFVHAVCEMRASLFWSWQANMKTQTLPQQPVLCLHCLKKNRNLTRNSLTKQNVRKFASHAQPKRGRR